MTFPSPPRGIKAIPWRIPIYLYRWGFGWLLGSGFLLLRHQGRYSGKIRYAVLEIILESPEDRSWYVVSGFGTASDWYQNILIRDQVKIQIGRHHYTALARQLPAPEGAEILLTYANQKPGNLKALSRLLGYEIEFTSEGILEFGRKIPVIQFSVLDEE